MKKKSRNKTLISITVIALILVLIGISYAYWILTKEQTKENFVNSACLDVSIDEEAGDITLDKAYPILDIDGEKLTPYTFTIHNKCSDLATYQINLESLNKVVAENRLNPNYIKVKLNEVGQVGIKDVLDSLSSTDTTISDTYEAHKLMTGYLEGSQTKNFELRLWIDEKVTVENKDSMNKEFRSKISVTSTYLTPEELTPTSELALSTCDNAITATANASGILGNTITKYEYNIDNTGWKVGEAVQKFEGLDNKLHEIKLRVTDNKGNESEEVSQTIEVNYSPEMQDVYGKQIPVKTCTDGLYKVEHNVSEISTEWNKEEYRYAGVNPDNYVKFNNEIWRIIGLVNVKVGSSVEQRLKIVRTDGIEGQKDFGDYAWSSNNSWVTSSLKNMLNGIYYESSEGECYTGNSGSIASENTCDFNTGTDLPKGLDDTAKNMIDKQVIWNLGGWTNLDTTTNQYYEKERGIMTGNENKYPSEWSDETDVGEKHNGLGIIYISDYGYATNGGSLGRDKCFDRYLYFWRDAVENLYDYKNECAFKDWLKPNEGFIWGLMPLSQYTWGAYFVCADGFVTRSYYNTVSDARGVWPTTYLTKSVTITSGEGTLSEPYELSI